MRATRNCCVFLAVATGAFAADQTSDGGFGALKAVCAKCHNLDVVTDAPRSLDEWQDTVQKMVDRGARGTDAQFDAILEYLHSNLTAINVNTADTDELHIVLGVPAPVAAAIVARRSTQPFTSLSDLKTIPAIDAAALEARSRLIFFR